MNEIGVVAWISSCLEFRGVGFLLIIQLTVKIVQYSNLRSLGKALFGERAQNAKRLKLIRDLMRNDSETTLIYLDEKS